MPRGDYQQPEPAAAEHLLARSEATPRAAHDAAALHGQGKHGRWGGGPPGTPRPAGEAGYQDQSCFAQQGTDKGKEAGEEIAVYNPRNECAHHRGNSHHGYVLRNVILNELLNT